MFLFLRKKKKPIVATYILPPGDYINLHYPRMLPHKLSFSAQLVFEKIFEDFSLYIPIFKFDPHCGPTVSLGNIFCSSQMIY